MFKKGTFFSFVILSILLVHRNGFSEGAKSSSLGTAFTAVADDPSAMSSNPAGLTQTTGANSYVGVSATNLSSTYQSLSGQKEKTEHQIFYVPHLFVSSDFGSNDTRFGVGIFSPFGIGGRRWNKEGLTRYVSTDNAIGTLAVNPTAAYKFSESFSAGFGLDYMLSIAKASMMVDQSFLGAGDGEISTRADGHGWGYNAGILFSPSDEWGIGLAYRSRIKIKYEGDLEYTNIAPALEPLFGGSGFKTQMRTTLTFPDIISIGAKFRPVKKTLLALDLEWTRWSSFGTAEVDLENEVPAAGLADRTTVMDWHDVWSIKTGIEVNVSEQWALRAGYSYIPSGVPDHTLGPDNPDALTNNISIGAGFRKSDLTLDLFYMLSLYKDRTVENDILSGKYENVQHSGGLSVGYRF